MATVEGHYPVIVKWTIPNYFATLADVIDSGPVPFNDGEDLRLPVTVDRQRIRESPFSRGVVKLNDQGYQFEIGMKSSNTSPPAEIELRGYFDNILFVFLNSHEDNDLGGLINKQKRVNLDIEDFHNLRKSDMVLEVKVWWNDRKPLRLHHFTNGSRAADLKTFLDENPELPKDIVLKCSDGTVKTSGLLLRARSEVFKAMFNSDMLESKTAEVDMAGETKEVIEAFLEFMDTDNVSDLNRFGVDLFILADKYRVPGLKAICENHLASNVTQDTSGKLLALIQQVPSIAIESKLMQFYKLQ